MIPENGKNVFWIISRPN